MKKKIEVWIVDDDKHLRDTYKILINGSDEFQVTQTFKTGEAILRYLQTYESIPEIVLMDIQLPGKSGIEITSILREKYLVPNIIMITVYDQDAIAFQALKNGATGYLTKSVTYAQLINALKEVVRGGAPISGKIARLVIEHFHTNPNSPLTKREKQILQLVAHGKSFTQISDELFISRETTKSHVKNIYTKLHVNKKADAIEKAYKEKFI